MGDTQEQLIRFRRILGRIRYKNSKFVLRDRNGTILLRHIQVVRCAKTWELQQQGGRWFFLSPHMTDEEVLRTAFLAVKLFEEHEINETFLVDGERFLNPHPEGPRP